MTTQHPTAAEVAVAQNLGEALLRFLLALRAEPPKVEEPSPSVRAIGPSAPPKEALPVHPLLISAREAAVLLSISARTLWARSSPRGPIPAVRVGGIVRYSVEDLTEWVKQARKQGVKP